MKSLRLIAINVGIAMGILLVLFVILEIAARIYLVHFASPEQFKRYASLRQLEAHRDKLGNSLQRYTPHRYIGYIPTPNYVEGKNRHNSLGYRGAEIPQPKPKGEFRIVCIGGSTTYTADVEDWHLSYPAQLQTMLQDKGYNVRVVNAGAESWMSYESLINFELRVLDLHPDMIIVYHAINDIVGRFVWPHSAYKGDNSGAKGPRVTRIFMPSIWEYSTLIRFLLIRTGHALPQSSIDATLNNWQDTFVGYKWYEQNRDGDYPQGVFVKEPASAMLQDNPPEFFRRNISAIVEIAKYHGIVPVLATFAHSKNFEDNPWSSSKEIAGSFDESNRIIKEIAKNHGAILFDFASEFTFDKTLYTDGFHVNEKGAHKKAALFAAFLIDRGLLPRPAAQ